MTCSMLSHDNAVVGSGSEDVVVWSGVALRLGFVENARRNARTNLRICCCIQWRKLGGIARKYAQISLLRQLLTSMRYQDFVLRRV